MTTTCKNIYAMKALFEAKAYYQLYTLEKLLLTLAAARLINKYICLV